MLSISDQQSDRLEADADKRLAMRITALLAPREEVRARKLSMEVRRFSEFAVDLGRREGLPTNADVARAAYLSILFTPQHAVAPLDVCKALGVATTADNLAALEGDLMTLLAGRDR